MRAFEAFKRAAATASVSTFETKKTQWDIVIFTAFNLGELLTVLSSPTPALLLPSLSPPPPHLLPPKC